MDTTAKGEDTVAVTWPPGGPENSLLSNPATLTVNRIRIDPADHSVFAGSSVTFSVAVWGTPTRYQWRFRAAGSTGAATLIPGATSRSYTRPNLPNTAAGDYMVVVSWANGSHLSSPGTLTVLSDPLADSDGDGLNALLEFALNLDPNKNERVTMPAGTGMRGLPLIRSENVSGQQKLTAEYVRRRAIGQPGITCRMEFSGDLGNANSWTESVAEVVTQIDATWERVKVTDVQPALGTRYGRLKVTMP